MDLEPRIVTFLKSYLDVLGLTGYDLHHTQDDLGYLLYLKIPKTNNERIGVFRGKNNQNLKHLKHLLRVIGFTEKKDPKLVVKLTD